MVVDNLNHDAHVVVTSSCTSFDCDSQLAARVELDARAAVIVSDNMRKQNAAVGINDALVLSSAEVRPDDVVSRSDHLYPTLFQQQAARAEVGDRAKIVGNEDDCGTARDHRVHALDTLALEQVVPDAEHLVNEQH